MSSSCRCIFRNAIIVSVLISMCTMVNAQYEWLTTFNYSNATINRIANIPGVTWVVADNSAYDQNHQHFFFQGNATAAAPWYLYTINAVTGAIIYNPLCPAGNPSAGIEGLQYDNNTDTLYTMYTANGNDYFSWLEPSTGTVHIIMHISGTAGYIESTFDTKDHLY